MESILTSIKKLLGMAEDYTHFDDDVIMHINSVLMILTQMGIGPSEGFSIEGAEEYWTDFVPAPIRINLVKSYVYLKVKLLFDPPLSGIVIESMNRQIAEYEWRLTMAAENLNFDEEV